MFHQIPRRHIDKNLKGIPTLTKVIHSYSSDASRIGSFWGSGKMKKSLFNFYHEYSHKIKTKADSVIGGAGILSMKIEKQLVLYAGHLNHPIRAETPLCYKSEPYKTLTQIKPAPKMPDEIQHDSSMEEAVSMVQIG